MKTKEALRKHLLTTELLSKNGWEWEWPTEHCNYQWWSKKGIDVDIKYYDHNNIFYYKQKITTVGELKDICKIVYGKKISLKI